MHKAVDAAVSVRSFGPDRRLAAVLGAAAAIFAIVTITTSDPAGRLLAGLAGALLALIAAYDLVLTPRLIVSAAGVQIRTAAVRDRLGWDRIDALRVDDRNRFGLASRTLEIDAAATLVVLSRHALGADPRDVLTVIRGFQP